MDAYHAIAECPYFNVDRAAAIEAAAKAAELSTKHSYLARVFRDVAAMSDTVPGQAFVFLATLGATIRADGGPQHGLPLLWAECLQEAPSIAPRRVAAATAVATITLPAFGAFAATVAAPLPAQLSSPAPLPLPVVWVDAATS